MFMLIRSKDDVYDSMSFYPQLGRLLSNGHLLIPFGEILETGERIDGRAEVTPEYSDYIEWRDVIIKAERKMKKERKRTSD